MIAAAWRIRQQLDKRVPEALRGLPDILFNALKLAEESGEVAEKLSGTYGHNPRKGVHSNLDEVADEAFDVAMSALVLAEMVVPGYLVARVPDRLKFLSDRARESGAPDVPPLTVQEG
jgi:hypothetical protein